MPERPNPEKLLKRITEEERKEKRGKLKIYLGAAPGVGKTYAMLQDALAKLKQGLDVLIGIVESHGRCDVEQMLKDFEVLPRQKVMYHNRELVEFDLDAVLKRNPGLVLIDEMAHTNVPGLRHNKRWQDIKEILDRGIDVYTTLNVQHIESLNDAVSQIIHARVQETVPDFMIEMANIIELIDLSPEDLLKRLQEGKVYFPEQAALAADKFFRKGNLSALRELALRVTAERVGEQMLLYRQGQGIKHIWPTKNKLLVCVSASREAAKLVRSASRLAKNLQAEWVAVHVDVPKLSLSKAEHNEAIQALHLAEQLGASTQMLSGFDVAKAIMEFAREQNVTQIVIGKHIYPRWWSLFLRSNADELMRQSGEIDVYVITGDAHYHKSTHRLPIPTKSSWKNYLISITAISLATIINFLMLPFLHNSNLMMIYLLAVTTVALLGEVGPSLLASLLSVLAYKFFFIPPYFSLVVPTIAYFFNLVIMLIIAYVISHLTIMTKRQAEIAHQTEQRTAVLHTLSRQLASTRGVDKLLNIAVRYLGDIFNSSVLVLLFEEHHLKIKAAYHTEAKLSAKEQGVTQWVYEMGQMAGFGTDTLPFADSLYLPLLVSQGPIGVLRIHPIDVANTLFTPEQMHLLEACANQVALVIEVDYLQEQIKNRN